VIHTTVIPSLRRLKQEDYQFQASLGYNETLSQKRKTFGSQSLQKYHNYFKTTKQCHTITLCQFSKLCANMKTVLYSSYGKNGEYLLKAITYQYKIHQSVQLNRLYYSPRIAQLSPLSSFQISQKKY
jgi:hypothetical protein